MVFLPVAACHKVADRGRTRHDGDDGERATGYVAGGISPVGQRRRLPVVLDASAMRFATVFCSGGRRGLEIELAPANLVRAAGAKVASIGRPGS